MADLPDEISLTQAAHLMNRDYASARDLALRGIIQARQVAGRAWVVDRASVVRFLESGKMEPVR
jgi:hypothetical protein